jgi:hypothetical protein
MSDAVMVSVTSAKAFLVVTSTTVSVITPMRDRDAQMVNGRRMRG